MGVNRNTVNRYFNLIRQKIFEESLKETEKEVGTFELDESYFGAKRVRGKRGRGAAGKTPVFGLLKRGEKVFTQIVPNCSKEALMPIRLRTANTIDYKYRRLESLRWTHFEWI